MLHQSVATNLPSEPVIHLTFDGAPPSNPTVPLRLSPCKPIHLVAFSLFVSSDDSEDPHDRQGPPGDLIDLVTLPNNQIHRSPTCNSVGASKVDSGLASQPASVVGSVTTLVEASSTSTLSLCGLKLTVVLCQPFAGLGYIQKIAGSSLARCDSLFFFNSLRFFVATLVLRTSALRCF